jgi:hypothetical protein
MNGVSLISFSVYLHVPHYVSSFGFDSVVIISIFLFLCFVLRAVYSNFVLSAVCCTFVLRAVHCGFVLRAVC